MRPTEALATLARLGLTLLPRDGKLIIAPRERIDIEGAVAAARFAGIWCGGVQRVPDVAHAGVGADFAVVCRSFNLR